MVGDPEDPGRTEPARSGLGERQIPGDVEPSWFQRVLGRDREIHTDLLREMVDGAAGW